MKYIFVVDKIRKVLYSCKTIEQLLVGKKYVDILIERWKLYNLYNCHDHYDSISLRKEVREIRKWTTMLFSRCKYKIN